MATKYEFPLISSEDKKLPLNIKIIAKEKFPNIGILAYQSKLVGKSHRKSDSGPINEKIPLIDSKTVCI